MFLLFLTCYCLSYIISCTTTPHVTLPVQLFPLASSSFLSSTYTLMPPIYKQQRRLLELAGDVKHTSFSKVDSTMFTWTYRYTRVSSDGDYPISDKFSARPRRRKLDVAS
ncbi:uncharacterized protein F5147DRAFT_840889 [Suillus discolor]|uniref:Uncharacterized protein n=1 Tax=Suillus discolor TaxID=1912936 RepID=A0A9P7EUI9_9AGAM|nr:uncharacterized protein F5147DRAFT_840889 [Suillus discolor]KAG2091027.1 hypothetical protein F5147DRAFT_840889 [Suillus discolor]